MELPDVFSLAVDPSLAARSASISDRAIVTWSGQFRQTLSEHREFVDVLRPRTLLVSRTSEYGYTFDVDLRPIARSTFLVAMKKYAAQLAAFSPGRRIYFFSRMDLAGEGWPLHNVFALLRTLIARQQRRAWSAMYTPLAMTGARAGEFELHADMYRADTLMNVFENVPADGSGQTTLLPVEHLFAVVDEEASIPARVRRQLRQWFGGRVTRDAYTALFDLLHGPHPWVPKLEQQLDALSSLVRLNAHEGYLLHDRMWLHGRQKPTGGVPRDRLRRLIYCDGS